MRVLCQERLAAARAPAWRSRHTRDAWQQLRSAPCGFCCTRGSSRAVGEFRCISLAVWQDFLNVRSILNVKSGGKRGAPYSLPHWNACHLPRNFIVSLRKQFSLHFLYASWQNYCFKFDSNGYSDESIKTSLAVLSPMCSHNRAQDHKARYEESEYGNIKVLRWIMVQILPRFIFHLMYQN